MGRILMNRFIYSILVALILFSCKKEEIGPQCPSCESEVSATTTDVLIGCEGNFGWGNASITKYEPVSKVVSQQVFQSINGFSLGDVLQSFCIYQDKLYLIINNSGKVEVIDTASYTHVGAITGLNSPRFMVTHGTRGYISDLYSNGISIVDLGANQVVDTIPVGRWSEHLLIDNNMLYIACPDTNWVLKYDLTTEGYVDTMVIGKSPGKIVKVNNGNLWMLCSGGYQEEIPTLHEYDGTTISKTLSFGSITDNPSMLTYDSIHDRLFYLNDGLFTLELTSSSLPSIPVINSTNATFYGLGIDPNNRDIYITDAVDYVQSGRVLRFDSLYHPVDTFSTGIIPQAIWFK
ncbi:YncE family protein [Parvicella tangerina]|uniref:YncE family protein n=1 Tax=Parvicella tangerina TaxID=2829795 RepID=A0A916JJH8_9FLAO|nr:DUF5074 domain-containing protein [Parvicella tangerina]CAG5076287.1 hypothetical protein CRYO30217_00042 [Parvicella tangerina]